MTVAIMQPYFFPYIGYFQLMNAADKFIVYDDVNYIKQGWIARNKILLEDKEYLFSLPVAKQSSFCKIRDTGINKILFPNWKTKFLKTIEQAYRKAPCYKETYPIITEILEKEVDTIAELAINSIEVVRDYLDISCEIIMPDKYKNNHLSGQARVIDICLQESADKYINVIGGMELYEKQVFKQQGIDLFFIRPLSTLQYKQFRHDAFVPWLSIIDVLMFNPLSAIRDMLNECEQI